MPPPHGVAPVDHWSLGVGIICEANQPYAGSDLHATLRITRTSEQQLCAGVVQHYEARQIRALRPDVSLARSHSTPECRFIPTISSSVTHRKASDSQFNSGSNSKGVWTKKVVKVKHPVLGDVKVSVPVKTYENVSQFWTWKPEDVLSRGPYTRQ